MNFSQKIVFRNPDEMRFAYLLLMMELKSQGVDMTIAKSTMDSSAIFFYNLIDAQLARIILDRYNEAMKYRIWYSQSNSNN